MAIKTLRANSRAVAKLEHPNIVQVFDVGYEQGYFYIMMQPLRTQTFEDRMADLSS